MKKAIISAIMITCVNIHAAHVAKLTNKLFCHLDRYGQIFTIKNTFSPYPFNNGSYYSIGLFTGFDAQNKVSELTYQIIDKHITDKHNLYLLYRNKMLSAEYPKTNLPLITLTLLHAQTLNAKKILTLSGKPDIPLTQEFIDTMLLQSYRDLE